MPRGPPCSSVAQWQSIRLLTGGLLVRVQPEEPIFSTRYRHTVQWGILTVEHMSLGIDPAVAVEWRLRILDWMACGTMGLREFEAMHLARAPLYASFLGHVGRYLESVRTQEERLTDSSMSPVAIRELAIGVAGSWFICGAHIKGWWALTELKHDLLVQQDEVLMLQVRQTRIMMLMRLSQIVRWLHASPLVRWVGRRAELDYLPALDALERSGEWGRLQALQLNAHRLGIARPNRLPLPPREGYLSLGARGMLAISIRDELRPLPWTFDWKRLLKARRCLRWARQYGWSHEEWKLHWMLFWRGPARGRWGHLIEWFTAFKRTQYTLTGRAFQLINVLLPHG